MVESAPLTLRERRSIWCDAPAMRVVTKGIGRGDVVTLLVCGIAVGGCKMQCSSCATVSLYLFIVLLLCYSGLQLEVAKRSVTPAGREELGCRSYNAGNWEAAQSRSASEK